MRILVVDDHEAVRHGVLSFLRTRPNFDVCGEAIDGEDAVQKAKELRPDVVLMDVNMPKLNGLNATREIQKVLPDTKVLILSQHDSTELRREALSAGASGYVDKFSLSTELKTALEQIDSEDGKVRRESEAATVESENLFRQIIEAMPAAVYTTDLEGRLTHFNQAAVKFSGRVPELGTDQWCVSWKLYNGDGTPLPHDQCPMAILLREGRIIEGAECIAERPDGTRRWFVPFPRPLRDKKGKLVGGMNMLLDITQRKLNEQANNLLAAIVDSSDDAIVSKNLDGFITSWNKSAERIFGYAAKEAIGQHITLIIPQERMQEEAEIIRRIRAGVRVDHFETVRRRKDGRQIDVSLTISPVRDAAGHVVGASKVARDITREKRAEQALRESEERFRSIVDTTPECVKLVAADGTILHINTSGLAALGAENPRDVVGKSIYDFVAPEHREKFCGFNERICEGEKGSLEFTVIGLKGARRDMETHAAPLRNPDGSVIHLGVTRDVTERKQAEEMLRKSKEFTEEQVRQRTQELEARNADVLRQSEQLRQLSRSLLHAQDEERRRIARELHDSTGQLLAALQLNLTLLSKRQPAMSNGADKHLTAAIELADQATKEIRTTSYLLHPPLLDEMGLAGALQWYAHGVAERSGLQIDLHVSERVERLSPELELVVFRIVQECLTNVHRHSESKSAAIRLARSNGNITVEVQDAGKGMSAEKLAQAQAQGSGVGLRGMQERVRQFRGKMEIESKGFGTNITVTLPAPVEQRAGVVSSEVAEFAPLERVKQTA